MPYINGAFAPASAFLAAGVPVPPPKIAKTTVPPVDPAIITAGNKYDGDIFFGGAANANGEFTYTTNVYTQGKDFAPEVVSAVGYPGAKQIDEGTQVFVSTEIDANGNLVYRVQATEYANSGKLPQIPSANPLRLVGDAFLSGLTAAAITGLQRTSSTTPQTQPSTTLVTGGSVYTGKITVAGKGASRHSYTFDLYKDGLGSPPSVARQGYGWPGDSLIPVGTYVLVIPESTGETTPTNFTLVNPKPDFDVMPGRVVSVTDGGSSDYTVDVYPKQVTTGVGDAERLQGVPEAGHSNIIPKLTLGLVVKRYVDGVAKYSLFGQQPDVLPAVIKEPIASGVYKINILPNGLENENSLIEISGSDFNSRTNLDREDVGIVTVTTQGNNESDFHIGYNFMLSPQLTTTAPGQVTGSGFAAARGVGSQFYNVKYYPDGLANDFINVVAELLPDEDGNYIDLATNLWVLVSQSGKDGEGNPLYYISQSKSEPGGSMPGKVVSGGPGNTYQIDVYPDGINGGAQRVTAYQLQIDSADTIPANTWAIVTKNADTYYFQVAVWL